MNASKGINILALSVEMKIFERWMLVKNYANVKVITLMSRIILRAKNVAIYVRNARV